MSGTDPGGCPPKSVGRIRQVLKAINSIVPSPPPGPSHCTAGVSPANAARSLSYSHQNQPESKPAAPERATLGNSFRRCFIRLRARSSASLPDLPATPQEARRGVLRTALIAASLLLLNSLAALTLVPSERSTVVSGLLLVATLVALAAIVQRLERSRAALLLLRRGPT